MSRPESRILLRRVRLVRVHPKKFYQRPLVTGVRCPAARSVEGPEQVRRPTQEDEVGERLVSGVSRVHRSSFTPRVPCTGAFCMLWPRLHGRRTNTMSREEAKYGKA